MLTKLCSKCGRLMEFGSAMCPACQAKAAERHKMYDNNVRDKRSASFYASPQWIRLRDLTMARAGYQCQLCKQQGKITPATEVHHIVPIRVDWSKRLAPDNCIALCHFCHMSEHKRI